MLDITAKKQYVSELFVHIDTFLTHHLDSNIFAAANILIYIYI